MTRRVTREGGFTLIEVVTACILLVVLGGVIAASVAETLRANLLARDCCDDAMGLGRALQAIEKDLRAARKVVSTGEGGRAAATYQEVVPLRARSHMPTAIAVPTKRPPYGTWPGIVKPIPPTVAEIAAVEEANKPTTNPGGGTVGADLLVLALPEGEVRWRLRGSALERVAPGRAPAPYARNVARAAALRTGALVRVEVELGKRSGEAPRRPIAVTEVRLRCEEATR